MIKYINIQILRAIAAILVVIDHSLDTLIKSGLINIRHQEFIWHMGQLGVIIFFVISGFIMYVSSDDNFSSVKSSIEFIKRRIIRVVPIYWIATAASFSMALVIKTSTHYEISDLIKSLLFIPFSITNENPARPILGQGWTLNYEMFFYAIFALSMLFNKKIAIILITTLFFSLLIVGLGINNHNNGFSLIEFYTDKILISFLLGIFIGIISKKSSLNLKSNLAVPLTLALISTSFLLYLQLERMHNDLTFPIDLLISSITVSVCAFSQWNDNKLNATFVKIGDSSYCLYLFHVFILAVLNRVVPLHSITQGIIYVSLAIQGERMSV